MGIENEIQAQKDQILLQQAMDSAMEKYGFLQNRVAVISPPAELAPVIQEVLPQLKFDTPLIRKTLPDGHAYIRRCRLSSEFQFREDDVVRDRKGKLKEVCDVYAFAVLLRSPSEKRYPYYNYGKKGCGYDYLSRLYILEDGSIAFSKGEYDVRDYECEVTRSWEELKKLPEKVSSPRALRSAIIKAIAEQKVDGAIEWEPYEQPSIQESQTSKFSSKNGCYIATAVYGSYDCPEVWTLRRYRDYTLAKSWHGRAFVRFYYAISPTLVRWFGKTQWFKNMWKPVLDRKVIRLNSVGVPNTPYAD